MPALVILIDEYAELAEKAPGAMSDTDSIARLGRAVAVTLIAATQRPTQKAMGAGAVRSQMDLRICFRVREPRDVDLILGQGMLKAGWDAHNLNAPGKFLVSAPGHDRPKRARAYLLTDEVVADTAAHYAGIRPVLDEESRRAIDYARWTRAQSPDSAPAKVIHRKQKRRGKQRTARYGRRYAQPRPKGGQRVNSCALPDGSAPSFTGTCASTPKRDARSRSAGDGGALGPPTSRHRE